MAINLEAENMALRAEKAHMKAELARVAAERDALMTSHDMLVQATMAHMKFINKLKAQRDSAIQLLLRYRRETPLNHQPHKIYYEVDELMTSLTTGSDGGEDG